MEQRELTVELRENSGKKYADDLRDKGLIPAILYGKGKSESVQVSSRVLEKILADKSGLAGVFELQIPNKKTKTHVIIKEVQFHPVRHNILHVDFERISLKEKIKVNVPIELIGEAKGLKEGGILEHHLWEIAIKCLPLNIPNSIKVDISNLSVGDTIQLKDVKIEEGMDFEHDMEAVVASVVMPKLQKEPVEGEAAAAEAPKEPEVIKQKSEKETA